MLKIAILFIGLIILMVIVYTLFNNPTNPSPPNQHAPLCSEEPCPTPL